MKVKATVLVVLAAAAVAVLPTAAYASCSMAAAQTVPMAGVVKEELGRLAPWKPGSDPRDVAWFKDNLVRIVPEWLPKTKSATQRVKPEVDQVVDDCYRPGDYSTSGPARSTFVSCATDAVLTRLAPAHLADWTAVCGEVRGALGAAGAEERVRTWARGWVDTFVEYARDR